MNRLFLYFVQIVFVLVMLSGCTQASITPEPSVFPSPTISISPTAIETVTPRPTFTLTPTVIPTFSPEQELAYSELSELIKTNARCELPCWWGITPGISTYQEAQEKLQPLVLIGDLYSVGNKSDMSISYPVGDLSLNLYLLLEHSTFQENSLPKDTVELLNVSTYMYQRIDLVGGDFALKRIYDSEAYKKQLSLYTLPAILSKFGHPSDILVRAEVYDGYPRPDRLFITILYPDKGIFATFTMLGEKKDNNLSACPAKSFIDLWLLPEGIGDKYQEVLSSHDLWEGNFSYIQPLEQATHMTIDEFYQTFTETSEVCLQTPLSIWPLH